MDNYNRKPFAYLAKIAVSGISNPVVQVIEESTGEIVYTIRIIDNSYRPKVYKDDLYTVKIGDPDENNWQTFTGLATITNSEQQVLNVKF